MKKMIKMITAIFRRKEDTTARDQVDWSQYDIPAFIRRGVPMPQMNRKH